MVSYVLSRKYYSSRLTLLRFRISKMLLENICWITKKKITQIPLFYISVEYVLWSRADASIPQIKEFLRLIMTEMKRRGKNVRGPYLAWLELYKMVHENGQDADALVGMCSKSVIQPAS